MERACSTCTTCQKPNATPGYSDTLIHCNGPSMLLASRAVMHTCTHIYRTVELLLACMHPHLHVQIAVASFPDSRDNAAFYTPRRVSDTGEGRFIQFVVIQIYQIPAVIISNCCRSHEHSHEGKKCQGLHDQTHFLFG